MIKQGWFTNVFTGDEDDGLDGPLWEPTLNLVDDWGHHSFKIGLYFLTEEECDEWIANSLVPAASREIPYPKSEIFARRPETEVR